MEMITIKTIKNNKLKKEVRMLKSLPGLLFSFVLALPGNRGIPET